MKKITLKIFLALLFLGATAGKAQCLTGTQFPDETWTAECNTVSPNVIVTNAWAGEYSLVNVVSGETYTFASSVATDYITISTDDGATASAFGVTPLVWTSDVTGVIRYYFHLDDQCGTENLSRIRTIACGTPPCVLPQVSFSKAFDCGSSTFEVTADLTDMGSANSITVTDDQASPSQSISSVGPVTFGPYPFGTAIVLTVTNDDTPICNVASPSQVVLGCPPSNDECDAAVALVVNPDATCTSTTPGTIIAATPSAVDTAACFGTEDDDVWFSFVAENAAHIISLNNVAGSTADLYHSLWTGDCGTLTLVPNSCSDPNTSTPSGLVVGQTYYLRVYSWTATVGQTSTFDVCIGTPPPPPANDECIDAVALTVNPDASCTSFETGTIQSATASAVDQLACGGTEDDDVWYSFVASDVLQSIKFSNVAGLTTTLSSSLWTGDCTALTLVPGSCSTVNAYTVTGLTAGETYYLRVYTATATTGQNTTFDICIGTPPPPPANDDCSAAIEITAGGDFAAGALLCSNVSSTSTVGLPVFTCQTNRSNDIWYTVSVPASGSLTIETQAAPGTVMTDTVITMYTGSCGSLVEVGCDDDSGTDNFSLEQLTGLTPGSTLYIGIWKWGTSLDGDFLLSAYDASLLSNTTFNNGNFKSFPNPVKDILNLSYDKNISSAAVYNLVGQEVLTKAINSNQSQIDMTNLSAGTYFVRVTADNQVKTIKVIKE